jgi:hypothetical protein
MKEMISKSNGVMQRDYMRCLTIRAPRQRVFEALTTLEGLRGWWTPLSSGSPAVDGDLRVDFDRAGQYIRIHVDVASPPSVQWTCIEHNLFSEWNGTKIAFDLFERGPNASEIWFRHGGLSPMLACYDDCSSGWDYFLDSLVALVERGRGTPFVTQRAS